MNSDETRSPDEERSPDDDTVNAQPAKEPATPQPVAPTKRSKRPRSKESGLSLLGSLLLVLVGALLPFAIMASDRRLVISVPAGALGVVLVTLGLLGSLRSFEVTAAAEALSLRGVVVPLLRCLASGIGLVLIGRLAVAGVLPSPSLTAGIAMTAGFLWVVVETFNLGVALGVYKTVRDATSPDARRLTERYGFWLLVLLSVLHLPMLGSFGLIDPWETHYGEVAREMLARDDWVSLWWAHDGWFWSKPILNFWLQGLSFKLFGVEYMPGMMLQGITAGRVPQPEWACRFPVFLLATIGAYALYKSVAIAWGKRMAFIGAFILGTCPYWYMIERQTMADMPYVAPLVAGMAFLLLAFQTPADAIVNKYHLRIGKRTLEFHGFHLLFLAVVLCVLPQALYLISRNVTFHTSPGLLGFEVHADQFIRGSGGGNCGLPGNAPCKPHVPLHPSIQPFVTGLVSLVVGFGFVFWYRKEQRRQVLYFLSGWLFTAVAVMAKGAPGLVIPLVVALAYPALTGRFRDLLRMQPLALLVLLLIIVGPWYLQMYLRHGFGFIERLILHDMFKRAFVHVHDTNKGDDTSFRYYIWQLGYGLFPWTGFAALGLGWLGRSAERRADPRWQTNLFFLLWWLVAFGMFTITLTKFHHYILPLVPPTAVFAGVLLAKFLPKAQGASTRECLTYYGGLLIAAGLVSWGAIVSVPGPWNGKVVNQEPHPGNWMLGLPLLLSGLGVAGWVHRKFGAPETSLAVTPAAHRLRPALAVVALFSSVPLFLAGRDMFFTRDGDVPGQARLLHLFTYNYARKWPAALDFDGVFLAFTLVCVAFTLAMAVTKWRATAAVLLSSSAFLFSVWCVNVYFVNLAPHWGQRETMLAYYQQRNGPQEQLVAFQMNWKGENFYTGNRMATFVSSGKKFKTWITEQREAGKNTFFFTTEHTRLKNLKKELDDPPSFEVLTDETLNNKFALARATFPPLPAKSAPAVEADDEPEDSSAVGSQE